MMRYYHFLELVREVHHLLLWLEIFSFMAALQGWHMYVITVTDVSNSCISDLTDKR